MTRTIILQWRVKIVQCLSTTSTKIHSARVMVTCAKMATWCHVLSTWHVHVCKCARATRIPWGFQTPNSPMGSRANANGYSGIGRCSKIKKFLGQLAQECLELKKSAFFPFSFSPRAHYTGKVWADRCFRAAVLVTQHARPNGYIYRYIHLQITILKP